MIAAVLAAAAVAAAAPAQVLVVTETRGFVHDSIPAAKATVGSLGYRTAFLNGARELTANRLRHARVVVFLNTSGELRLDAAGKRRLLAYVRDGGGLVGTHSAADTFHDWPRFQTMLGAEFRSHPPPGPATVDVVDRAFTAARSFAITEEFYAFKRRAPLHVIARLRGGGPLAWWRRYGRGRVFYDALGHFPATWSDPNQRRLVADGLRWAMKRSRVRCVGAACPSASSSLRSPSSH